MADRRVLVTGVGGEGTLGHGVARAFAAAGASLAVTGRTKGRLAGAACDLERACAASCGSSDSGGGGADSPAERVTAVTCDPLDAVSVSAAADEAICALGGLDVLVVCTQTVCSVPKPATASVTERPGDAFEGAVPNVSAASGASAVLSASAGDTPAGASACPSAVDALGGEADGGALELALQSSVRNVSAWLDAAHRPLAASAAPAAVVVAPSATAPFDLPAALVSAADAVCDLVRRCALEWAREGITVNAVCPLARTAQIDKWAAEFDGALDRVVSYIPLGRLGDSEADIGAACVFLASDTARYITGQILCADGGASL